MRAPPTPEEMLRTARAVRELREQIDAHLRGAISADELRAFASRAPGAVAGNRTAHEVIAALMVYGRMSLIRREDVVAYAQELAVGVTLDVMPAASVTADLATLASELGVPLVHRDFDGWGLGRTIQFASPASGRVFTAIQMFDLDGKPHPSASFQVPRKEAVRGWVDLVETCLWRFIEPPDAVLYFEADPTALPVVALLREDDNGNRVEIREYRSHAGAMAECERLESLGHKQRYWVEVRRPPGA